MIDQTTTPRWDRTPPWLRYLRSSAAVLTRTNRILADSNHIRVEIVEDGSPQAAPAWTDGTTISIVGGDRWRDIDTAEGRARLLGLNYHELAHILFTPRDSHPAYRAIQREGLFEVYNLAEDPRIETLFCALYSPAVPLFTQAITDLILADADPAAAGEAWVLLAGRRYLPQGLRQAARDAYRGDAAEWERLITEYLLIDWDADTARGLELLRQMAQHLQARQAKTPSGCGHLGGRSGQPNSQAEAEARQAAAADIDQDGEADGAGSGGPAEEMPSDEAGQDGASEGPGGGPDSDHHSDRAGAGSEGQQGSQAEGQTGDSGAGGEENEPSGGRSGGGVSAAEGTDRDGGTEAVQEQARAARAQAEAQAERDLGEFDDQVQLEIDSPTAEFGAGFPKYTDREPVTDLARSLAGDVEQVLAEIRVATDPGWVTHTDRGRINAGRFGRREAWEPLDDIFDEWREGVEDALDIEIVLLVDTSGSMGWETYDGTPTAAQSVAECTWALKRALAAHNIALGVLAYDDRVSVIYAPDEEADEFWMPAPAARGGTMPGQALWEAGSHLATSTRKHRMLVALTDGRWPGTKVYDYSLPQVVAGIDAEHKVLLLIGDQPLPVRGFTAVAKLDSAADLAEAVRETIVASVLVSLQEAGI